MNFVELNVDGTLRCVNGQPAARWRPARPIRSLVDARDVRVTVRFSAEALRTLRGGAR